MVEASYPSRCPVCDEPILIGDEIAADSDGEWCHADCVEDES